SDHRSCASDRSFVGAATGRDQTRTREARFAATARSSSGLAAEASGRCRLAPSGRAATARTRPRSLFAGAASAAAAPLRPGADRPGADATPVGNADSESSGDRLVLTVAGARTGTKHTAGPAADRPAGRIAASAFRTGAGRE